MPERMKKLLPHQTAWQCALSCKVDRWRESYYIISPPCHPAAIQHPIKQRRSSSWRPSRLQHNEKVAVQQAAWWCHRCSTSPEEALLPSQGETQPSCDEKPKRRRRCNNPRPRPPPSIIPEARLVQESSDCALISDSDHEDNIKDCHRRDDENHREMMRQKKGYYKRV